jgi:hypothetical protein
MSPVHLPPEGSRVQPQGWVTLGAGEISARFLSSAALAVACCRRSASDFRLGFGVDWVASGCFSEREHAPPKKAHANKTVIIIVFIGKRMNRGFRTVVTLLHRDRRPGNKENLTPMPSA